MHTKLELLVAPATAASAQTLRQLLTDIGDLSITMLPPGTTTPDTEDKRALADVLIYELQAGNDSEVARLQQLRERARAGAAIYVLGQIEDPTAMRRLMQMGVRDVLRNPLDSQELQQALHDLKQERLSHAGNDGNSPLVVSFFSTFGNSGGTLLAVNVATTLASQHRARVALLDFNMLFGKAGLLLGLKPQNTILDALHDPQRLDPVFLKALMCAHESGLQILAAPAHLGTEPVQASAVNTLLNTVSEQFDVIIIDLPRQVSDWTLALMRRSDRVMLVTQNNLSAIRNTTQLLTHLPQHDVLNSNLEVVNNHAMTRFSSTSVEQMKRVLGVEYAHRVRHDSSSAQAAEDRSLPLAQVAPHSPLTVDCAHLADYLWGIRHPSDSPLAARGPNWLNRLLGRQGHTAHGSH